MTQPEAFDLWKYVRWKQVRKMCELEDRAMEVDMIKKAKVRAVKHFEIEVLYIGIDSVELRILDIESGEKKRRTLRRNDTLDFAPEFFLEYDAYEDKTKKKAIRRIIRLLEELL